MSLLNIIKNLRNQKGLQNDNRTKLLDKANKIINKDNSIEFETYKRLRYDEFVKTIQFYRDLIDDYDSKNHLLNKDNILLDLIKCQNIFVKHLIKAETSTQINSYFEICMSFIYKLIEEQHIEVRWFIN